MQNIGRSTLTGKTATLAGFGYGTNPLKQGYFISFLFYRTPEEWVICSSEGPNPFDLERQRNGLGAKVPGELIAPYAVRSIEGKLPYEAFQSMIRDGFSGTVPDIKFEWADKLLLLMVQ